MKVALEHFFIQKFKGAGIYGSWALLQEANDAISNATSALSVLEEND